MDREKLQAEALDDIKKVIARPRTTMAQAKRETARIFVRLRRQLGETPETTIIQTGPGDPTRRILKKHLGEDG